MFRLNTALFFLSLSAIADSHPSHHDRRRLAPETSIIGALYDQLAEGVDHPRFAISAEYKGVAGGLFAASTPFAIDVVLTDPSVDESTSFSIDGGPSTSVQSTSKLFISDQVSEEESKYFAILTVNEEQGLVSGLVQKDGKLLKLEQRQGGATVVTEAAKFDPPKDWECTVARDRPTPVAKENPNGADTDGRRLERFHEHDDSHEHHKHSHNTLVHHTLNLSSSSESIFSQVSNINTNILKNRRRLYQTDNFPLKWSYQVDLYIEVDTAMIQAHDPSDQDNMPNTIAYINALITAASSVYEREVDTHLHVIHIAKTTIYDNQSQTSGALDVMMSRYSNSNAWHYIDSATGHTPDLHHGIFYKSMGGGIAYLTAVCDSGYGYGVSAGVRGSLDDIGGEMFWDLTVVMHELGHNFGSDHTHDTGGYNPKVDACGDGICTSLVTGDQIQSGEATIMSYCHLCSGGESNIGATFGGHWAGGDRSNVNNWVDNSGVVPFSQNPRRVAKTMYEHVSSQGQCTEPYLPVPSQVCTSDSDCDDGFICSIDSCDIVTGSCSNTFKDSCCGNGQCEAGENGFNCPADCGPFELATPTCNSCWVPDHAMFDVEAIKDIVITSLSFLLYGGVSNIKIYSAPQSYSSIATNPNEWTLIASGSVSTSNWATMNADIEDIQLIAGSKRAFYIVASGGLAIAEDSSTPLAADENLKLLNPTRISYAEAEFGSAYGGIYSWVGSISYTVDGGDAAPTTNQPSQPTATPSKTPVTDEPTSTVAAAFSKMEGEGYCVDGSGQWYSAFKSSPLPLSTTDSYCLNWCGAISRTDLIAVETYMGGSNVYCFCDFPGGQVPQDISLSDFNPAADSIVSHSGDGPVISTDSVQGASCYVNTNFVQSTEPPTQAPSRKPTTESPTQAPSHKPTTESPTQAPSLKPTTEPSTHAPSRKPTTESPTHAPSRKPTTKSPTQAPSRKPTTESPTQAPSRKPTTESPTQAPTKEPVTPSPVTSEPVSSNPSTPAPITSVPVTTSPTDPPASSRNCYPRASAIKIQSTTGQQINLFEVNAISSSGLNVALKGSASQSSTLQENSKFKASNAIDNEQDGAFTHTDDPLAWWQVTLDAAEEIERIALSNRYCRNADDPPGCLCRLSDAKVLLFDASGSIIYEESVGNTCGSLNVVVDMTKSFSCSSETPSPTPSVTSNLPKAKYLKLHSITGASIQVNEVEIYNSAGQNIAIGNSASQSTTLNALGASLAIDGDTSTFQHTNSNDSSAMWEVDLGRSESIKSIRIINRYCVNPSDPKGCLCRLSFTVLSLFDEDGNWISTTNVGDTCSKLEWNYDFSVDYQSICDTWV